LDAELAISTSQTDLTINYAIHRNKILFWLKIKQAGLFMLEVTT